MSAIEASVLGAKERVTGAEAVITTDHAFIHDGIAFTVANKMDIASTKVGALQITVPGNVAAAVTINMTNATADLTYTAVKAGSAGNLINVVHVDPGANDAELAVSVFVETITVSLATDGSGTITSTAAEVKAAVNAHAEASALVICEDEGAGSGIVNAVANTNLAGGTDAVYCHFKPAAFAATGGPVVIGLLEDYTFTGGSGITPVNRKRVGSPAASKLTVKGHTDITAVAGSAPVSLDMTVIPGNSLAGKLGGSAQSAEEWVLCPGKNYLVTMSNLTNPGATVTVGYELFWYEEGGA
ncbi:MAG: hypothetical protein FDZ69_07485 [Deltaproteobacteria bacterium]|nr:MAG: hypothetical protein FDZ69_07485 [Deltaproteobacteria bacterium]